MYINNKKCTKVRYQISEPSVILDGRTDRRTNLSVELTSFLKFDDNKT